MMKQVVFIHGGESFATYDDYLAYLRVESYEPFKVREKKWREWVAERLGDGWEAYVPSMPSPANAKYLEWSIWFEKVIPYLTDGAVLVGHSLGGIFLAKYLSENELPVRIAATFLIASPYDETEPGESLADFALPDSLAALAERGGKLFLYHSEDDPVVAYAALDKYRHQLPEATVRTFTDRGHFLQSEFPELLEDIQLQ